MTTDRQTQLRLSGARALQLVHNGSDDQAARLYPDSDYLQAEWRRAVAVVRATARGWLMDRQVPRL